MYQPSDKDIDIIKKVYDSFKKMKELRNNSYHYFNDMNLIDFVNRSEKLYFAYTPHRRDRDRDWWQSNFYSPAINNKVNSLISSIALDTPDIRVEARDEKNDKALKQARIIRELLKHSYDRDDKELKIIREATELAVKGTVIVFDTILKQKAKKKIIKNFDENTGEVEFEEKEINLKNEIVDFIIPLENFYIASYFIPDIQNQPAIIWVDKMNKNVFKEHFRDYKNYDEVKTAKELLGNEAEKRWCQEEWTKDNANKVEVIRYYNKYDDEYIIIANGVLLLNSPMILGSKGKVYPFAKSIFSMFSQDFFYGNSMPNKLAGIIEVEENLTNMSLNKTYKSLNTPILVGMVNKDDFDNIEERMYLQDINQVKPMPVPQVTPSEFKMLEMIKRDIDISSVDSDQQQTMNRPITAREIVINDRNSSRKKSLYQVMLSSLWLQKYKIRLLNILDFYSFKNKNDEDLTDGYKIIIGNTDLGKGQKGTLELKITEQEEKNNTETNLSDEAQNKAESNEENYKIINITKDELQKFEYSINIMSETIFQKESYLSQAKIENKLNVIAKLYPDVLQQNKEKILKQIFLSFDDDPDEWNLETPQPQLPQGMQGEEQGMPQSQPQQPINQ